jgi:trans-aconitate methyltransferase
MMFWTETEATRYLEENGVPYNPKPHVIKKMTAAVNLLNGLTVLDVGCGEGHLYHFIKDKVEKYVGLDASPEMLKKAGDYAPEASWRLGDVYNLEDVDRFDTVFSIS